MPLEPDLIELMLDEVTIEPWTGSNAAADPVFGSPITVRCRIEENTRRIIAADGRDVISSVQVTIATPSLAVSSKDRLTLPSGKQPELLKISAAKDDSGDYYKELFA